MKNFQFRFVLAAICFASILLSVNSAFAGPVRLNEVVQTVNAKPGDANNGDFSRLLLVNEYAIFNNADAGNGDDKTVAPLADDDRVITTTKTEIVEEGPCDCEDIVVEKKKFPYWVLGFAAIPLIFLWHKDKKTPTPTIPITTTPTPETPTPTPKTPTPTPKTPTPTPKTPTPTKTPPPTMTPTPPEPVPEPMTLLLFGTGLAGIGVAARKRFGKKKDTETSN
jgi:hypothetical protein